MHARPTRGQVADRCLQPVARPSGDLVAPGEHEPRQLRVRLRVRQGHHHIAAQEPDRVLHTALLPAAGGIAEPGLDPVVPERTAGDTSTTVIPSHATRCPAPVASYGHHDQRRDPGMVEHHAQPHGARIQRSPREGPPRSACSNAGTRPPGNARPSGSRRPRPAPDRNPPASPPATTPAPSTPRPARDAPASNASHTAARSDTSRRTPARRPAGRTRAWRYDAACGA